MAEKIKTHTDIITAAMGSLISYTWASNYYEMIDEESTISLFNQLSIRWTEIQAVLNDMTPRLKELFEEEHYLQEGTYTWNIYLEEADSNEKKFPIGTLNADTMVLALEKASKVYRRAPHDLVAEMVMEEPEEEEEQEKENNE
jgi:hypothetical protein